MATSKKTDTKELTGKDALNNEVAEFFIERYFSTFPKSSPERTRILQNTTESIIKDFYSSALKESGVNSPELKRNTDAKMAGSVSKIKSVLDESIYENSGLQETLSRINKIFDKETASYMRILEDIILFLGRCIEKRFEFCARNRAKPHSLSNFFLSV